MWSCLFCRRVLDYSAARFDVDIQYFKNRELKSYKCSKVMCIGYNGSSLMQ